MSQKEFWTAMLLTGIMVALGMTLAHVYGRGGDQTNTTDRGATSVSDTRGGE